MIHMHQYSSVRNLIVIMKIISERTIFADIEISSQINLGEHIFLSSQSLSLLFSYKIDNFHNIEMT